MRIITIQACYTMSNIVITKHKEKDLSFLKEKPNLEAFLNAKILLDMISKCYDTIPSLEAVTVYFNL